MSGDGVPPVLDLLTAIGNLIGPALGKDVTLQTPEGAVVSGAVESVGHDEHGYWVRLHGRRFHLPTADLAAIITNPAEVGR